MIKDENGNVVELHGTWDPDSKGGTAPDGRKVLGTIHWVSAEHAVDAEIRLYDRLFTKENPNDVEEGKEFTDYINPDSLQILKGCKLEPALADFDGSKTLQFERLGYFCLDNKDSKLGHWFSTVPFRFGTLGPRLRPGRQPKRKPRPRHKSLFKKSLSCQMPQPETT